MNKTLLIIQTIEAVAAVIIIGLLIWWVGYEVKEAIADWWKNRHAGGE